MENRLNSLLVLQDAYAETMKALAFAAEVGEGAELSEVKVLDIQPPLSAFWQELISDELEETPLYHRHKTLREMVRGFEFGDAEVMTQVKSGRAVVQAVRTAVEEDRQMIIKAAGSQVSDYLFGSLDFRLVRYSPVPVLLVHPKAPIRPQRILVALNPEAEGEETQLNADLLTKASELATHFHCRLGVVSVFSSPRAVMGHVADTEFLERMERHEKNKRKQCREHLLELLRSASKKIDPDDVFVDTGRPSEVILSAVDEFDPDLLVIGSVARQGIAGLLIGNTAERVMRSIDCSLLTIKPSRFKCPILE